MTSVGVSFLSTSIQGHWSSYVVTHPSPTFEDFQQFLFDFYDKNVGVTEARRHWQGVRQGRGFVKVRSLFRSMPWRLTPLLPT